MRKVISILLFVLSLTANAFAEADLKWVREEGIEGIIVPKESGRNFYSFAADDSRGPDALYLTPAKEDVLQAERALAGYLKETKPEQSPDLWGKIPKYYRQYVGVKGFDEKKMI